jgi:ketosteroid isomerase-like protein
MKRPPAPATLLLLLIAACTPPAPAPADAWVALAELDGGARRISYDSSSLRRQVDDTWEALARIDYAAEREFEGTRYTRQEMRIFLSCEPPPKVMTVSDTLRLAGTVVGGHTYDRREWAPVSESASPETRWPLEICRRIAAAPADTLPAAVRAAHDAYVAACNAGDHAALAALFADDAEVYFGDEFLAAGRAEIDAQWLAKEVEMTSALVMTPDRVTRGGGEVTESGTATFRFRRGDASIDSAGGGYAHVWARQPDGTWKLRSVRMDTQPEAP